MRDQSMQNCIFCKVIAEASLSSKIWEDKDFLAFLDVHPISRGHMLLLPKKHVEYVFDMPEKLYSGLFRTARQLSEPLQRATVAKRIGVAIEGFGVPHVHVHLVPVNKVNDLDPCRASEANQKDLANIAGQIRGEVSTAFDI